MPAVHGENTATDATLTFGVDVGQYLFVNYNLTTGVLQLPRVEGHRAVGVTQEAVDYSVKETGRVRVLGITKLVAGETILSGQALMPTTAGKAKVATGGNAQSAIALTGGAADELIEAVLVQGGECTVS